MRYSPLEKKVAEIVEPVVTQQGFSLVTINLIGEGDDQTLQILAENPETRKLNIGECTSLSREISTLLDVEEPLKKAYRLEVSSPGIDRPLVKIQDFEDFKGLEAKVEVDTAVEGQRKFRGVLKGLENETVIIDTDQAEYALPYQTIIKAKLTLNDLTIKRTKRNT